MKRIGILGGMSWESTALYCRRINGNVSARLGGLHASGSGGIVAACTVITMLVAPADVALALFDTTAIHADPAVALSGDAA